MAGSGPAQLGIQRVQLAQRVRAQAREHQITVHRQCPMPLGDQGLRVRRHVQGHVGPQHLDAALGRHPEARRRRGPARGAPPGLCEAHARQRLPRG